MQRDLLAKSNAQLSDVWEPISRRNSAGREERKQSKGRKKKGSFENSRGEGIHPEENRASTSTSSSIIQLVRSATGRISRWTLSGDRKRKREDEEPITHYNMLAPENNRDISQRINEIADQLHTARAFVGRVLQLEMSHPIATSNQGPSVTRNARMTTSIPVEAKVYGRDAERDKIVNFLINGKSSDLLVLSVVGNGGVGKTTLARFVYRDQRIRNHFDLQMWVCVSPNFDEVRLTREMLEHVCQGRQEEHNKLSSFNLQQLTLSDNIKNKRFLLVLDDIWEDRDSCGWKELLAPLKLKQATGSMILATTRKPSVAKMIRTMNTIELKGLDDNEFWLFFKASAFGDENCEEHPHLQDIGQQNAKKLKGNPLAAQSVGALLKRDVSYEHWKGIQDQWKSLQETDDGILPILKLSYDYLPFHLQRCFSYCSLFPEDHRFNGDALVLAWISQSFVQSEDTGKRLEEIGRQYLDNLLDLGFFQKIGPYYVMHDLMHELAEMVSSNDCATIDGLKSKTIPPSIRHLSIINYAYDKDAYEDDSFPNEKLEKMLPKIRPLHKLRTLMFFGRASINLLTSFQNMCKEAKSLRLLRMHATSADFDSTCNFVRPYHLRYLKIISVRTKDIPTHVKYEGIAFPQALTRFYHLQVLDVRQVGNLVVPPSMKNLINLQHLIAHPTLHSKIAKVCKMMGSLQELLNFKVQNDSNLEIGQIGSLNELVILKVFQLENVETKEQACGARLVDKERLEELCLSWNSSTSSDTETTREVLEVLKPHENLKLLQITGYNGSISPTWLGTRLSVTSLQSLHLENCPELQVLPSLKMLPFRTKLKLINMCNIMEVSIPSLNELVLIELPKLERCVGIDRREWTSLLTILMMKNCPELKDFTLFQSYCSFNREHKSWFPTLNKFTIENCPHIMKWEVLPLGEMRALEELELTNMPIVKELSIPALKKLVLTQMLSLKSCRWLTTSPLMQCSPFEGEGNEWPSSFRELVIHDCPNLSMLEFIPPTVFISKLSIEGVSTLPTIKILNNSLSVHHSDQLRTLDEKILTFHYLRGMKGMNIEHCPNLMSLSFDGFNQLIDLVYLDIWHCPNLLTSHGMSEAADKNSASANCLVLPSLKRLSIRSCGIAGKWISEMLPHMKSLEVFHLYDCAGVAFLSFDCPRKEEESSSFASSTGRPAVVPASLGQDEHLLLIPLNLPSTLKELYIRDCPDLVFCGRSTEAFRGFTSLQELHIVNCGKLLSSIVHGNGGEDQVEGRCLLSPSLQQIEIDYLPTKLQPNIVENQKTSLKRLIVRGSPLLKSLQLHYYTALEELKISYCDKLAVLEGLQSLSSLRKLEMKMNSELCTAWDLKSQDQEEGSDPTCLLPPSLEELKIRHLPDNIQSRLLPHLPSLSKLEVRRSPNLTSLQLGSCTTLKEFTLYHCESLASLEGLQSLGNLRSLKVHSCPELLQRLEDVLQQLGGCELFPRLESLEIDDSSVLTMSLCKHLTSLQRLKIDDDTVVRLTEEHERALQYLTSLQVLQIIRWKDLIDLPAELHRFSSLINLHISSCPSISRLPEKGLPPSLQNLRISRCSEELKEQCRRAATRKLKVAIE